MRSSVLLPQPDGPRMVTKSFSATERSVACKASVGVPRADAKLRETARTSSRRWAWMCEPGMRRI